MAIAVATTRTTMAAYYVTLGRYIGVTTGAPGSTSTPTNEATGGSPAYARKQTTWSAGAAGVQNGTAVTIDVAAGTYTNAILCSAATGANMIDTSDPADVIMTAQGQLVVTPTYTQL
jgi:hypothetical protein